MRGTGKMGKIFLSFEEDLSLLDLLRGQVALALDTLTQRPKTKVEYEKSFKSVLQVLQSIKKMLRCSQTTDSPDRNQIIEERGTDPEDTHERKSFSSACEPVPKIAKTTEARSSVECGRKSVGIETASVQKALNNSLIVQKIMRNLNSKALKSCRPTCKLWLEEATKELLTPQHNQFFRVKFKWFENTREYKHICLGSLSSFLTFCLKKSARFPCAQFQFTGGNLSSPTFLQFFTDFGPNVRFLRLNPAVRNAEESSLAVKTLGLVLFKLAPNLEGLVLNSIDWTGGQTFEDEIYEHSKKLKRSDRRRTPTTKKKENKQKNVKCLRTLPNLKKLSLPLQRQKFPTENCEMNQVLVDILIASVNLARIEDKNVFFTREIVSGGKFHLIKYLLMDFAHGNAQKAHRYNYFARQKPKLEAIEFSAPFDFTDPWIATTKNYLAAILSSSKDSLTTFDGIQHVDFRNYEIPRLAKVKSVFLRPNARFGQHPAVLPRGQKLADYFPNLERVTCGHPDILQNACNSSNLVNSLVLSLSPTPEVIVRALSLYPNLISIHLNVQYWTMELPETVKAICLSFPQLEGLSIHMNCDCAWKYTAEMDAAFTGLPSYLCKDLIRQEMKRPNEKITSKLGTTGQPSLRDLTKLKDLRICMEQNCLDTRTHRLCSQISHLYAFDLMIQRQGLKVVVVTRKTV